MLSKEEKNKVRDPMLAQTRQEYSKLLFSVVAMLARSSIIEIAADAEKYEKFILYLSSLRAETLAAMNE